MQRVYYDMAGRYLVPSKGVTLASLGVPPYSPPAEDWHGEDPASFGSVEVPGSAGVSPFPAMPWIAPETAAPGAGTSFADMVRTISPATEPEAFREDNRAPFWIPDDQRAISGSSFGDLVRTIDPRADQDLWREDDSTPRYAGWHDPTGYAVPYDPRAVALGAVRIPGLPEEAAEWGWQDGSPERGGDAETAAQLASILERWIGLEMLGADFTSHGRGSYPSIGGGGGGGGGGGRGGGTGRATGTSASSDRYIPGADAAGEGPNGPILKGYVYRSGGPNPGNWKAKPGQDHSVRDTPSNPWPQPDTGPVFPVGKRITEVDAAKLPSGSVVRDNIPPGHANISGSLLWDLIKAAIKDRTKK